MKTLIIHIIDSTNLAWLIADGQAIISKLHHNKLETIRTQDYQQCWVIVPGSVVFTHSVELPKMSPSKLRLAAPYALEDQLIDDIENLHFAFAPRTLDGKTPVAVVSRLAMDMWLKKLSDAGITPNILIPEYLMLPVVNTAWSIYVEDEKVVVRNDLTHGFVVDKNNFLLMLAQQLAETPLEKPMQLIVHGSLTNEDNIALEKLGVPITLAPDQLSFLALAASSQHPTLFNLLQGDYLIKRDKQTIQRLWHATIAAAGLWLLLLVAGEATQYVYLSSQHHTLQTKIESLYKTIFPNATAVVSPKLRIERELSQLQAGGNGAAFLTLLSLAGPSLNKTGSNKITTLNFQHDLLTVEIEVANAEILQKITTELIQKKLSVKQDNVSSTTTGVKARLEIQV